VAIVGSLAIGQTVVILTAGIDLSVGAIMILVTMIVGELAGHLGVPGWLALLIGLAVGTGAGFLNGVLVAYVRLPPFIVTLGSLNIFTALALLMSGGRSIPGAKLGPFLNWTNVAFPIGPFKVTTGVLLVLIMYAVVAFVLSETKWGRYVYAVGDDAAAARLAGIQVRQLLCRCRGGTSKRVADGHRAGHNRHCLRHRMSLWRYYPSATAQALDMNAIGKFEDVGHVVAYQDHTKTAVAKLPDGCEHVVRFAHA
jgi:predicted ABC-type sugar transport system permease subunit